MRIIAGQLRGKKLLSPKGEITRPTADRARETLFNILNSMFKKRGNSWSDLSFCDVFAGSGAIGAEALSRGVTKCLFFEKDPYVVSVLRKNISEIKGGILVQSDALKPPKARESVDVIFMDPPYSKNLWQPALTAFYKQGYIHLKTLVIIEIDRDEIINIPNGWCLIQKRCSGRNCFLFFEQEKENISL